jgi:hypothetical protein
VDILGIVKLMSNVNKGLWISGRGLYFRPLFMTDTQFILKHTKAVTMGFSGKAVIPRVSNGEPFT